MNKEELKNKLNFYIGFLDDFLSRGNLFLREDDFQSLKMIREYMILAIKELEA